MTATKPALAGKTILVTRPAEQARNLSDRLTDLGATVISMPSIEIQPLESYEAVDETLQRLNDFDWVILTSVNGVAAIKERMVRLGVPSETLARPNLAAIGPATAAALAAFCREPDLVPSEYVAEGLDRGLTDVAGKRILLARADIARRDLADSLRARGAEVEELPIYRIASASAPSDLPANPPDIIALTSSASARSTGDLLLAAKRGEWLTDAKFVCIGPITANTVREMGFEVAATAREYTIPGLVEAIVEVAHA